MWIFWRDLTCGLLEWITCMEQATASDRFLVYMNVNTTLNKLMPLDWYNSCNFQPPSAFITTAGTKNHLKSVTFSQLVGKAIFYFIEAV